MTMYCRLDSRWSLPSNVLIGGGNDKGGAFFTLTFETPLVLFGKI